MTLNFDFVLAGAILILLLIPLYIYKEKVYHILYKKSDFKTFLHNAQVYLKNQYPKINFIFTDIVHKTKYEKNDTLREILIVEDLVSQFIEHEYNPTNKNPIAKDILWSNYLENCKPNKDKLPTDWNKRKNFVWQRDKQMCQRCGTKLKLGDAHICLLKSIQNGGYYNFENLQTLCNDCNKIFNSTDLSKTSKHLNILDDLMTKVN